MYLHLLLSIEISLNNLKLQEDQHNSAFRPITRKQWLIHGGLFLLTLFTTTIAGVAWLNKNEFELANFYYGLPYSLSLLFILSVHEFGHYFASRSHRVDATLPFYIPFPFIPGFLNFGTLGAVIRTRTVIPNKKAMFDIGAAGPIAGFIGCLIILTYGFATLPPIEYLYSIHPEYRQLSSIPPGDLVFGNNLLYQIFCSIAPRPAGSFIPPMSEIYHYPFLCTGWFGLFVTAMNLLPIGQLDGGHIAYTIFGSKHKLIARTTFGIISIIGIAGILPVIGIHLPFGWIGWVFWAAVLLFVVKLDHPEIYDPSPLTRGRISVGWVTFIIFLLSFSTTPFYINL